MSDLIDRQKAINSVHSSVKFWDDGDVNYLIELIVACLQELPSAEDMAFNEWCTDCKEYNHEKGCCPRFNRVIRETVEEVKEAHEEKHGHWIESDTDGFVCSECRNGYRDQPTMMGKPMFEYCPVCGAKMDKVER